MMGDQRSNKLEDSGRPGPRRDGILRLIAGRGKRGTSTPPIAPPAKIERKRTDLWGKAYDKIQEEDSKLLVAYKKYLLAPKTKGGQGMLSDSTFCPAGVKVMASGCNTIVTETRVFYSFVCGYQEDYPCLENKWLSLCRFLIVSILV
jgi:hypothetical protein